MESKKLDQMLDELFLATAGKGVETATSVGRGQGKSRRASDRPTSNPTNSRTGGAYECQKPR
jgi:hypothetical protein